VVATRRESDQFHESLATLAIGFVQARRMESVQDMVEAAGFLAE